MRLLQERLRLFWFEVGVRFLHLQLLVILPVSVAASGERGLKVFLELFVFELLDTYFLDGLKVASFLTVEAEVEDRSVLSEVLLLDLEIRSCLATKEGSVLGAFMPWRVPEPTLLAAVSLVLLELLRPMRRRPVERDPLLLPLGQVAFEIFGPLRLP